MLPGLCHGSWIVYNEVGVSYVMIITVICLLLWLQITPIYYGGQRVGLSQSKTNLSPSESGIKYCWTTWLIRPNGNLISNNYYLQIDR